ncbi:hypothetical protein DXG01_000679 [Tephrocybe rancida]|nr:hypothetical protein DXG01_000679 [Tephrocybe rancida]
MALAHLTTRLPTCLGLARLRRPKERVIVIKTERQRPLPQWLDNMTILVGTIRDASDLIPFPYVQFTAGIVLQFLKMIQAARKNINDFRGLSQKLVDTIVTVRDTINDFLRHTGAWSRFFKSTAITNWIADYKDQINDIRSNFTLDVVLRIFSKPGHPCYLGATSGRVYLVDAMNDISEVSMDYCSSPSKFARFVKFRFNGSLGYDVIERGDFSLSLQEAEGTQRQLGQDVETWRSLVQPDVTITMDILFRARSTDADPDGRQCPSCRYLSAEASLGDRVRCSRCGTWFYVSRAFIENVEDSEEVGAEEHSMETPGSSGSHPLAPDAPKGSTGDIDESHFRYFRRFRVLLKAIKEPRSPNIIGKKGSQELEERADPQGAGDPRDFDQPKNSESVNDASKSNNLTSSTQQLNLKRRSGTTEASDEPMEPASALPLPDLRPRSGGDSGGGITGRSFRFFSLPVFLAAQIDSTDLRTELNNLAAKNGLRIIYDSYTDKPPYTIVWTCTVYGKHL